MIWLVGKNGMLAKECAEILEQKNMNFCASDIETDICDISRIESFAADKNISYIVNCAAYTAVDKAEDEREFAEKINWNGVANLAKTALNLNACLIHISTDYVFDGEKDIPLTEDSAVNPMSIYGKTKLAGEEAIINSGLKKFYIIRTSWLYGRHGRNFVETMLNLMNNKEQIGVVADQWGSPTWARDLAKFIAKIIESEKGEFGVFHYSNDGKTNWFEFAKKIYEFGKKFSLIKNECQINALTTEQYPTKAKRPKFSYLSKEKAIKVFGAEVVKWENSLEKYLNERK